MLEVEEKMLALLDTMEASTSRRQQDISELAARLNMLFGLSGFAELQHFGSSAYGLCSSSSDLDLTIPPPAYLALGGKNKAADGIACLRGVHDKLQQEGCFDGLELRATARVPIVTFTDRQSGIGVDICADNGNGLLNTKLLKAYVDWDDRVRPLMMLVVRWAKSHKICGSTNCGYTSFLSSYSWKLLVIYFLQHTEPPVLPNLQYPDAPSAMFTANIDTEWGQVPVAFSTAAAAGVENTATLCSLYMQFFHFYTSDNFNLGNHVIDISNETADSLVVPGEVVGRVIGKKGANISKYQSTQGIRRCNLKGKSGRSQSGRSQVDQVLAFPSSSSLGILSLIVSLSLSTRCLKWRAVR
jgi:DNA polymerase sigma